MLHLITILKVITLQLDLCQTIPEDLWTTCTIPSTTATLTKYGFVTQDSGKHTMYIPLVQDIYLQLIVFNIKSVSYNNNVYK